MFACEGQLCVRDNCAVWSWEQNGPNIFRNLRLRNSSGLSKTSHNKDSAEANKLRGMSVCFSFSVSVLAGFQFCLDSLKSKVSV